MQNNHIVVIDSLYLSLKATSEVAFLYLLCRIGQIVQFYCFFWTNCPHLCHIKALHSMYCVHSSEWGLFGRNTRSAIRGTSSSPQRVSGPLKLKHNLAFLFARRRGTLAFGNKVAKNVAGDIGRLVPPLSPKIENFRGPHRKITLSCKSVEQATQREPT